MPPRTKTEQILFSATLAIVTRLRTLAAPFLSCSQLAGCTGFKFQPKSITSPSQGPLMLKITSQLSIFQLPGWGEGVPKVPKSQLNLKTVHFKLSPLLYLQDIILLPYYQLSITRCFNYFLVQSILIKSLCKTFYLLNKHIIKNYIQSCSKMEMKRSHLDKK